MKISRKDLFNFTESLVGSIEEVATKIAQIESILSGTDEPTDVEDNDEEVVEDDYVDEPTDDEEVVEDNSDVVEEPAVTEEEDEEVVEEPTEETEPVEFSEKSASRYETVKSFLSGE